MDCRDLAQRTETDGSRQADAFDLIPLNSAPGSCHRIIAARAAQSWKAGANQTFGIHTGIQGIARAVTVRANHRAIVVGGALNALFDALNRRAYREISGAETAARRII